MIVVIIKFYTLFMGRDSKWKKGFGNYKILLTGAEVNTIKFHYNVNFYNFLILRPSLLIDIIADCRLEQNISKFYINTFISNIGQIQCKGTLFAFYSISMEEGGIMIQKIKSIISGIVEWIRLPLPLLNI